MVNIYLASSGSNANTMVFSEGNINGVHIIKLIKHADERGFLMETFRADTLPEGLKPLMSYASYTKPGIARGPHEHQNQTDIFSFIGPGNFKIYLWDNRSQSSTYGKRTVIFGGRDDPITLIVPPGVVHAYRNISKTEKGMVLNFPDRLYAGWNKREPVDEVRHEDSKDSFYRDFIQ